MTHKSKIKELVGRGLNSYHSKALKQIDRIEKKNKEQNHKISNLTNELDNDYLTKTEEGSVIFLEHSKEGMVYLDELQGNTLVNYCVDGSNELTLNDEINEEGINVTLNNTTDNGIVDVSLEGETLVNVCNQKDPVAITKSYIVENSGNHIALQGEYDGKARPIIYGNTMVNYCVDGAKELTLNNEIDVEGTNVTLTEVVDDGLVDVICEGNTLVNSILENTETINLPYFISREKLNIKPNTTYTVLSSSTELIPDFEEYQPIQDGLLCWVDGKDLNSNATTWKDRSQNNNDIILNNIAFNEDLSCSAIDSSSYAILNLETPTSYTIETVFSYTDLSRAGALWYMGDSQNTNHKYDYFWNYSDNGGSLSLRRKNNEKEWLVHDSLFYLTKDEVYRSVITYDSATSIAKLYINGEFIKEVSMTGYNYYNTNMILLMNNSTTQGERQLSNGKIFSFMLYNRVLTEDEIKYNDSYKKSTLLNTKTSTSKVITTPSNINNIGLMLSGSDAIQNVMLLEGDWTNKEVPKYFEGMKSVGQDDENGHSIEIIRKNKNLFESTMWDKVVTVNNSPTSNGYYGYIIQAKPNTTYTISCTQGNADFSTGSTYAYITTNRGNATVPWIVNQASQIFGDVQHKITTGTDGYIILRAAMYGIFSELKKLNLQIEEGNTATSYTPYTSNTKTLTLNEPLRALPNGIKDRFVKKEGKWYIERNCGEAVLNGNASEQWGLSGYTNDTIFSAYWNGSFVKTVNIISDRLPLNSNIANHENMNEGIYYTSSSGSFRISILKTKLATQDIDGFRQWLSENPTRVAYELVNPIYEEITDPTLTTCLNTTYISNSSIIPCNMKIKNTGYNCILHPNTKYTVTLNTNKSEAIEVNLGGTKVVTNNNIVTITTPSTLTSNNLKLYCKGVKVSNAMVLIGDEISNRPSGYVEGLRSSFEEQKVVGGKNLFNKTYEDGSIIAISGQDYNEATNRQRTFYIEIKPSTNYVISGLVAGRVHFYEENKTWISATEENISTFTTPSNAKYIRFMWDTTLYDSSRLQLEEGTTPTSYEEYTPKYKVEYKITGKNKFNGKLELGYISPTGEIQALNNGIRSVDYISVKSNTRYTLTNDKGYYYNVYYYDSNYKLISLIENSEIITPSNCKYIKFRTWQQRVETDLTAKFQLEEGSTVTEYEPYRESIKTFYLNSPLLEEDTIEDVNGKATHVHRWGTMVLDGSENWYYEDVEGYSIGRFKININGLFKPINSNTRPNNYMCDKLLAYHWWASEPRVDNTIYYGYQGNNITIVKDEFNKDVNSLKQWLQTNPITFVYKLTSSTYETISEESILCDSYVNGHLDLNTNVPVEKVEFMPLDLNLNYLYTNIMYTIKFKSDKSINGVNIKLGGAELLNQNIITGTNKFNITTPKTLSNTKLIIDKEGANISNVSVVATELDVDYFEGMKSVGQDDVNGHNIEILSRNKNLFDKNKLKDGTFVTFNGKECYRYFDGNNINYSYVDKFKENTQYTYRLKAYREEQYNNSEHPYKVVFVYSDGTHSTYYPSPNEEVSFTSDVGKTLVIIKGNWHYGQPVYIDLSTVQIEESTSFTHYQTPNYNTKTLTLNEPLRALPNGIKDKIVKIGDKWYVERNCYKTLFDGTEGWKIDQYTDTIQAFLYTYRGDKLGKLGTKMLSDKLPYKVGGLYISDEEGCSIGGSDGDYLIYIKKSKLGTVDIAGFKQWLNNNPLEVIYQLATPIYEPLEIDSTVNTCTDTAHISNTSTIPCNMKIQNSGYNVIIKPSTLYTVALDTNKSGTIGINLGGSKTTTTNNVVTITTPATLTDDSLRLYGKGIKGSKVRLLEGDKTNYVPSFFEGMKSSFEDKLQDDGSYKMEILSNNENLWDGTFSAFGGFRVNENNGGNYKDNSHELNTGVTDFIKIDHREKYIYRPMHKLANSEYGGTKSFGFYDENKKFIKGGYNINPISIPNGAKYFKTTFADNQYGYVAYRNLDNIEHKSNKIQFSSIEPLRKWDRFVFKDGKLMIERNSGVKMFNGSESWSYGNTSSGWSQNGNYKAFYSYSLSGTKKTNGESYTTYLPTTTGAYSVNSATSEVFSLGHSNYELIRIDQRKLNELSPSGLCAYLNQNPLEVVYQLKNPTYEEIPFELQKIILEGYENGTLFFDTNIPPTVTTTYSGETPIVKATRLNKSEVLNNTNDINDNIVPYLMDMDFRVVCLQLESGVENISMARLFGGTYEMLQRDIQSKRYSVDEYKHRLDVYLNANKIIEDEYEKLKNILN